MAVISVVIPVFNVEKYLKDCFLSLINQSGSKEMELIFVDDGSTDSSGQLLDELVDEYRASFAGAIKVVHQQNGGLSAARNAGMALATGEWLQFVDSDDILLKDAFKGELEVIEKYPESDYFSFNAIRIDENGKLLKKLIFTPENLAVSIKTSDAKFNYLFDVFLNYQDGWEAWNRLYKRSIVSECGLKFYPTGEVLAEDMLFNLLYIMQAQRFERICNIFYGYRVNNASLISNVDEKTIIPRMLKLVEVFYDSTKDKYIKKNFYKIFFQILNFQINYELNQLTEEEIWQQINDGASKNRKLRRLTKQLLSNKSTLQTYQVREWLR